MVLAVWSLLVHTPHNPVSLLPISRPTHLWVLWTALLPARCAVLSLTAPLQPYTAQGHGWASVVGQEWGSLSHLLLQNRPRAPLPALEAPSCADILQGSAAVPTPQPATRAPVSLGVILSP